MQELETEILSYLLIDFSLIKKAEVNEHLFLKKKNRDIFKAAYQLFKNNGTHEIDISTLAEKLEKKKISFSFKVQRFKEKRLAEKVIKEVHEMARTGKFDVEKAKDYLREIQKIGSSSKELNTVKLSSIPSKKVDWLWQNYFPLGRLALISGDPNDGKTYLSLDLSSRITKGTRWPDGEKIQSAGNSSLFDG